jgi:alginate O-acetyltransferase complex protein AlgI
VRHAWQLGAVTVVFTTHLFVFYYLPLFLLLYYVLPFRARTALIALGSYLFYGWANPLWALLMFLSSGVDYVCGLLLLKLSGLPWQDGLPPMLPKDQARRFGQKAALVLSVSSNLALLAVFKYYGFAEENLNSLSQALGFGDSLVPFLQIVLPIGISFYTFKSMSYAIDVYCGDARPMTNFADFCCFEAFFPDLVAGPIVRYGAIEQQMRQRSHTVEKFARGVAFFGLGMAKKILIANPMGCLADTAFTSGGLRFYDAWYGVVAYAFQIYFDFSGYSDMASGLALMMGFVLIQNFDSPYKSDSITDFWRRWHISLSTWLRDYLYIPLGGNRHGPARTYLNLIVVMLVGGLWHGASWNFVIWGGIHGFMLVFERFQGKHSPYGRLPRPMRVGITFAIVCITWVFFRAKTLGLAWTYLTCMCGLCPTTAGNEVVAAELYAPYQVVTFVVASLVIWQAPNSWAFTRQVTLARACWTGAVLALAVILMWTQTSNPFIYFQF